MKAFYLQLGLGSVGIIAIFFGDYQIGCNCLIGGIIIAALDK